MRIPGYLNGKFYIPFLFSLFFFLQFQRADAAILFMSPKSGELKTGQQFDLEIRVNAENQAFNAAQATIQFPKNVLEVKSIDISPSATIFNFWLEGPDFSNEDGTVKFIGGATNGVSGGSILILKIKFLAKGSGAADIVFSDAAVTASDGSGTNILSMMEIARLVVSPTVAVPAPAVAPAIVPAPAVPPPALIIRRPEISRTLPDKPKISVPLYANGEELWYNLTADFLAKWELPMDISDVNAAIDRNYSYFNQKSDGLFDSKVFPAIKEDGAWYIHVRFKNNVGWGPVGNYRVAIDTLPPQPFKIESLDGFKTKNPAPTLRFKTNDGLSGIGYYRLRIDGGDFIDTERGEFKLPPQGPGKHAVLVAAVDKAGNSIEDMAELEILPIDSPVITFVNKDVFVGEGNLTIRGTSLPNASILFSVKRKTGEVAANGSIAADDKGNWETTLEQPLKKGEYFVEIFAQDQKMALSLPVNSDLIRVRYRPLFAFYNIEITETVFFIGLIFILLVGFGIGWFSYRLWLAQVGRRTIIAQRDIVSVFKNFEKEIDRMLEKYEDKVIQPREAVEIEFLLKKLKENLNKFQKYILENIEEIPK